MSAQTDPDTVTVGSGAVAGALVVVAVWVAEEFFKIHIPAEVASALTTLLIFAGGLIGNWWRRTRGHKRRGRAT